MSTFITFITLATLSSFVGLNIVRVNAGARMIYPTGRDGMLPRWLDHTTLRHCPSGSALVGGVWGASTALILGSIWAPVNVVSWASFLATPFFIAASALLNVGVVARFYRRDIRDEFTLLRHVIVPVVGLVGIGLVTYGNVHLLPPSPLRYFIWATLVAIALAPVIAVWLESRIPRWSETRDSSLRRPPLRPSTRRCIQLRATSSDNHGGPNGD